jgi:hypothetical protein
MFSVHKDAMEAAVRPLPAGLRRVSNLLDDGLFAWVRETAAWCRKFTMSSAG